MYPAPDELTAYEKDLIKKITEDSSGLPPDQSTPWMIFYRGKYFQEAMAYKPKLTFLDLTDLPAFAVPKPKFIQRLSSSLPNIGILIFYNLLFFTLAFFSFAACDPRRNG